MADSPKAIPTKRLYGCLMVSIGVPNWESIQAAIPEQELYEAGNPIYGRQDHPHCTILFGFHHQPGLGEELIGKLPVDLRALHQDLVLTGCNFFRSADYDVLKFSLQSPELARLNHWCKSRYAYTSDFPEYLPHATLAYLRPGNGEKYVTKKPLRASVQALALEYSPPTGQGPKIIRYL